MFRLALGARSVHRERGSRRAAVASIAALAAALVLSACGGGGERQDADEPEGTFTVDVTRADFETGQKLAKRSQLVIEVRNADTKTIPNVAVTVKGFDRRKEDKRLADPRRPVFVINGEPAEIGGLPESRELSPRGGDTAYVNTWALGRLAPGESRIFSWDVTAVQPGDFRIEYRVSAGLDGKAKAVLANGQPPTGVFTGEIDDEPPESRIASDGKTIVRGK